jgi:phage terminase large subunit GpA-like protein
MYLMGDQRKWFVPCPKCGAMIELIWYKKINEDDHAGIYYKLDSSGVLIESSVGYVCQECSGFFKERNKYDMNLNGEWRPTAKAKRDTYYSYHLNALYAAPFMFGWIDYTYKWLRTFNDVGNVIKSKRKVFHNIVLGLPWEERKVEIKSSNLAKNTRQYKIGEVPNLLSKNDGNGNIVLLTCACDLNGYIDDARLDYEVMGHAENGSTYSIDHGSIGTFQRGDKDNKDRIKWTYRNEKENNVWDYFLTEIVNKIYNTDEEKEQRILITGVDTGFFTHFAYHFIDSEPTKLIGLKGETIKKTQKIDQDVSIFKAASERARLYLLKTDKIKDGLADRIDLKWAQGMTQPPGFMNFPEPSGGKYTMNEYFSHFESEEKKIETNDDNEPIGWVWDKRHSGVRNHFWDCAVYNLAVRDIISQKICKELNKKYSTWSDFAEIIKSMFLDS